MKVVNEYLGEDKKPDDPVKEVKDSLAKEDDSVKVKDLKRPGRQSRLSDANGQ